MSKKSEEMLEKIKSEAMQIGSKDINAFINETKKLQEIENLRLKSETSLMEKKGELEKEKSKNLGIAEIETSFKIRKNLEDEITNFENIIHDIDVKLFPPQVDKINTAREKVQAILYSAFQKVKEEYQTQLNDMFLKCETIMSGFKDAYYSIQSEPGLNVTQGLGPEMVNILVEFDTSNSPRSNFERMTGMNTGILRVYNREMAKQD